MGAAQFIITVKGKTARKAFQSSVESACYLYGNSGYTGTIAEKLSFIEIQCPEGKTPIEFARELLEKEDSRIDDKWGSAGCIKIKDGEYLFFGLAPE